MISLSTALAAVVLVASTWVVSEMFFAKKKWDPRGKVCILYRAYIGCSNTDGLIRCTGFSTVSLREALRGSVSHSPFS